MLVKWTPPSSNAEIAAREVLSAAMWLHSTFKDEIWLWRGQADKRFGVEPGMHTRVLNAPRAYWSEAVAADATRELLRTAREMGLDRVDDVTLPDLALLAGLQHHGAATPLIDVSTDPLIALWMIAFASAQEPDALDGQSGYLFGIRKPPPERWISPLDARAYVGPPNSISASLGDEMWWYEAPDVTERLRIQRGSFLLGPLYALDRRAETTLPLKIGDSKPKELNWLQRRMANRGKPSNTTRSTSDLFAIVVTGATKQHLRRLLGDRSGLTVDAVYPTPWHRPFIVQFAQGYGRSRSLLLDVVREAKAIEAQAAAETEADEPNGKTSTESVTP